MLENALQDHNNIKCNETQDAHNLKRSTQFPRFLKFLSDNAVVAMMQRASRLARPFQRWCLTNSASVPTRCASVKSAVETEIEYAAAESGHSKEREEDDILGPAKTWVRRRDRFCTGPYENPNELRPKYPKRRSPFARAKALINALHEEEGLKMMKSGRALLAKMGPRTGDIIRVEYMPNSAVSKVVQSFTGIVMSVRNRGMGSGIVLRNVVDGIAIERAFPLYSPNITNVELVGRRKVHRAKLTYLREKKLKESTFAHVRK